MSTSNMAGPVMIELGDESWSAFLDRFEAWLDNVLMTQSAFRRLAENTVDKIEEPHIRTYLGDVAERARDHERHVDDLYQVIGRRSSVARKAGGTVLGKVREGAADVVGLLGGAVGGWREMRELLLANQDAMGAFAIAEQLGLALGMPEVVDITFPIVNEKSTQQLLIQEYMLEMASNSILYHEAT